MANEERYTGTVVMFSTSKGYGFIKPDDVGADAFVHINAVRWAGMDMLYQGDRLSFVLTPRMGQTGKLGAEQLRLLKAKGEDG